MKVVYNPDNDKIYFAKLASFLLEKGVRDDFGEIIQIEDYDDFKLWIDKAIQLGAPKDFKRPMYKIIFDKINNDGYLEGVQINDLVTYYSQLDEIEGIYGPEFLRILPIEEDYFSIDLNTRKITAPTALSNNQWVIGVKEDHLAELLWFKVDRFMDGQDLAICFPMNDPTAEMEQPGKGQTYIQWKNNTQQGLDPVKHVQIEEDVIYFAWYLRSRTMQQSSTAPLSGPLSTSGKLTFSVLFEYRSINATNPTVLFSLNTDTVTCNVLSNLTETLPVNAKWLVENLDDIEDCRPHFSSIFNNTKGPKANITQDLPSVQDLTQQDEKGIIDI